MKVSLESLYLKHFEHVGISIIYEKVNKISQPLIDKGILAILQLPTFSFIQVVGFEGLVPADKGFIDAFRQTLLTERHGILLITPPRKGMTTLHPPRLLKACARLRKCVETVGSHLTERFAIARIRVHDLWHFHHRLIRKILAHTVGVFLNLQQGHPPLDLDGLLAT